MKVRSPERGGFDAAAGSKPASELKAAVPAVPDTVDFASAAPPFHSALTAVEVVVLIRLSLLVLRSLPLAGRATVSAALISCALSDVASDPLPAIARSSAAFGDDNDADGVEGRGEAPCREGGGADGAQPRGFGVLQGRLVRTWRVIEDLQKRRRPPEWGPSGRCGSEEGMASHGDPGTGAAGAMLVVVAGTWKFSSCSLTGATAESGTTDQHQQYGRNSRKNQDYNPIANHGNDVVAIPF